VFIQAYVSPEVPEAYVEQRETLLGLLRQYDAIGRRPDPSADRRHRAVQPEARQAEDQFGIKAENVRQVSEGDEDAEAIYMGVAFTCGTEEVVIPVRPPRPVGGVRTHAVDRHRVGRQASQGRHRNTDARLFGGSISSRCRPRAECRS
jgi:hypothetical protein